MKREIELMNIFPLKIRNTLQEISMCGLEEIRIRVGKPIELIYSEGSKWLKENEYEISIEELEEMMNYLTAYSYYAMEEEIRQGYITILGGHRVGIVGRVSYGNQGNSSQIQVNHMVDIGGLNIRIAHEKKGCSKNLIPYIVNGDDMYNTLILAAPGIGKTTYLRDVIRVLSSGNEQIQGKKICVIDERSEIAACCKGKPQNDLGKRCDVLDACPKELGMKMVLRSMSPDVIAVDELGKEEEFMLLQKMRYSGVHVLGTIHAGSMEELLCIYDLHMLQNFERFIELKKDIKGERSFHVYNGRGDRIC